MPMGQESLERQLALASAVLTNCVAKLDQKGVAADQRKRNSVWRGLESKVRTLKRRMNTVKAIAERDAECVRRKTEVAAE